MKTTLILRFVTIATAIVTSANLAAQELPEPLSSLREVTAVAREDVNDQAVDVTATITYWDPLWNMMFIQDGEQAIFVSGHGKGPVAVGSLARIKGKLSKGELTPIVVANEVTELGASQLPVPTTVDLATLKFGEFDCRYVSAECEILQAVTSSKETILYGRAESANAGFVKIKVRHADDLFHEVAEITGRRIRITGALGLHFQAEDYFSKEVGDREIEGFFLFCSSPRHLEVLAADADATDAPPTKVLNLTQLENEDSAEIRFQAFGQVSLIIYDDRHDLPMLVAFDNDHAMRFHVHSVFDLHPGMVFELCGTKKRKADGTFRCQVDCLRQINLGILPKAPLIPFAESIEEFQPNRRIRVEGRPIKVIDDGSKYSEYILLQGDDGRTVDLQLQLEALEALAFADPNLASRIQVTGVTSNTLSLDASTSEYELIVAKAEDIELIESHSYRWRVVAGVLFGIATALGLPFVWTRFLKFQVDKQTEVARGVATQLRYSYDAIDDGVLVIDSDQVVLAVNDAFRRLVQTNIQFGDNIGDLPTRLQHRLSDSDEFRQQWHRWLSDPDATTEMEIELDAPNSSHVVVRSAPVQVVDEDKPVGRIMMWRDETDARQLQAEVLRSNKLEAIGRLVGGVAHDFNNILTAISGNLIVARLDRDASVSSINKELEVAEEAAFRGADLVRRLLTFSTKAELDLEHCSINDIIRRLGDLIQHTFDASITFTCNLDSTEPYVNVQSTAIEQVLLNLYVNAKDSMPNGGVIRTSTSVIRQNTTDGYWVLIAVEDDGTGVADEIADKIFEPYFTTKEREKGTGIGLSVSYRVVTQHGGKLRYKKLNNGGSEFQILLPLVESPDEVVAATTPTIPFGASTVLVVDDEEPVRNVAENILRSHGFQTLSASGGVEAIAIIAESSLAIDAVLLDMTMPGISGREVLALIRKRWPKLPVVLCSGYLMAEPIEAGSEEQPDAIVSKPYSAQDLITPIYEVTKQNCES